MAQNTEAAASPITATKTLMVLASSGGNLRSQGGADPAKLIAEVCKQASAAGMTVGHAQLVEASVSMDDAEGSTPAKLWSLVQGTLQVVSEGTLAEVNQVAKDEDSRLAGLINSGEVDGLVLVSADPSGANNLAIEAAIAQKLPASGTGGTSIAEAQKMGLNLVAVSGTTGTTNRTRAVSYISGLARHWKVKYRPDLGGTESTAAQGSVWKRVSLRGIMVGSLPAFIALAVVLALSKIPAFAGLSEVFDLLIAGLPVVVAAVAARRISGIGEVGLVAGVVAGVLSVQGGVLGGLVAGILAGLIASWMIGWTLAHRFPATTANIVTGAFAGLLPGLLVYYLLSPVTVEIGDGVKTGIEWALNFSPLLAGALAGLVIWPAIIGGVYHSVILPLVLLEMAQSGYSFFGAIDMVALVMVSLGITLANVVKPRTSGERALAGSGALVNFFFGTFVEASYPFMFGDKKVFASALLAATVGGTLVGVTGSEATAYLPAVVAPFVSSNTGGMILAMVVAAALAFVLTLLANVAYLRKNPLA